MDDYDDLYATSPSNSDISLGVYPDSLVRHRDGHPAPCRSHRFGAGEWVEWKQTLGSELSESQLAAALAQPALTAMPSPVF